MESSFSMILEICLNRRIRCEDREKELIEELEGIINKLSICNGVKYSNDLPENIRYIRFYDPTIDENEIIIKEELLNSLLNDKRRRFFTLKSMEPIQEPLCLDEEKDTAASCIGFTQTDLPHSSLDNIWDNLIFPKCIKKKIIGYTTTLLQFSKLSISDDKISTNRFILFHGPPGTGKTSLAKGFAQKMSIRLNSFYQSSILVEINCHSLFSKWFSQSAKLVSLLFDKILNTYAVNKNMMVFVLIDEIESIGLSREKSMGKNDPGDVVRVLNSFLTQLDKAKKYPNVMFIGTSNMNHIMDEAISDRIDLDIFIGYPCLEATYTILKGIIEELMEKKVLVSEKYLPIMNVNDIENFNLTSINLYEKARNFYTNKTSARRLRKVALIPFAETFSEKMDINEFIRLI
ncbi:Pachytene checkpoint protein 2 homolog [Strongyloides ratti]|uniref:Pachytene checkpoint protein 2 homolog n=1 Tax=Strongyloides ratti TaxID=34506 RepID=A0A090LF20_STRRB|nr:Pachytene checkpoint protein 2 homolog [Strongyloides ratti]CEF66713.1 Pachytene checkpoint protein 2 homolog [Strongyloides ratti]